MRQALEWVVQASIYVQATVVIMVVLLQILVKRLWFKFVAWYKRPPSKAIRLAYEYFNYIKQHGGRLKIISHTRDNKGNLYEWHCEIDNETYTKLCPDATSYCNHPRMSLEVNNEICYLCVYSSIGSRAFKQDILLTRAEIDKLKYSMYHLEKQILEKEKDQNIKKNLERGNNILRCLKQDPRSNKENS